MSMDLEEPDMSFEEALLADQQKLEQLGAFGDTNGAATPIKRADYHNRLLEHRIPYHPRPLDRPRDFEAELADRRAWRVAIHSCREHNVHHVARLAELREQTL